jgi:hypothetical protein
VLFRRHNAVFIRVEGQENIAAPFGGFGQRDLSVAVQIPVFDEVSAGIALLRGHG